MAGEDTVIVNFQALESAINSFTTSANRISDITSSLRSNAQAIQSAVESQASDAYAAKMEALSGNFSRAEELLTQEVATLRSHFERSQQAEAEAEQRAESVSTFNMQ